MFHASMSTTTYPAQLNEMGCLYHNISIHSIDTLTNQPYIYTRELPYITVTTYFHYITKWNIKSKLIGRWNFEFRESILKI